MVTEENCMKMIFEMFPEFKNSNHWKEHCTFWGNEKSGLGNEMMTFDGFIADELNKKIPSVDLKKVFSLIELFMLKGNQTVRNVAATCFLENLLNYDSAGRIKASSFIHFLGPESREYCKAWDEFTGVKTEGL